MTMTKADLITARLQAALENAKADLEKFSVEMQKDPCYALTWGDRVYLAAGKKKAATTALGLAEVLVAGGSELEAAYAEIAKNLTRKVLQEARYMPASTSQSSNLMEHFQRVAHVEILEMLEV